MEHSNIYHLIILDESGLMTTIKRQAVGGLNETLGGIRSASREKTDQNHFVSIVSFEGDGVKGVKTIRDRVPIEKVENITMEEYHPGACTPLYDAMGVSLTRLESVIGKEDLALVTIITDGMENSSEEWSGKAVKALVGRLREKGWTFAYIGANQDAVEVARELDIRNALNFDATPEGAVEMGYVLKESTANFCMMSKASMADNSDFFVKKPGKK